jgi:hypothetical protein
MGSTPKIGRSVMDRARTSAAEELTEAPEGKVLGTIDPDTIRKPTFEEDGAPPWETDPKWVRDNTNARRFVDVPDTWELRWLSPRVIDHAGLRDWKVLEANHERIKVKVRAMIGPDNTIRKGGHGGMLLAYMPKSWVISRQKMKNAHVDKMTQTAVDRQREVTERINRGEYGIHTRVDHAVHPTHTSGRALDDN